MYVALQSHVHGRLGGLGERGDTPEQMLAKLSSALQTVKEVCQENTLTLNMSAGKTEATVLLQGKQSKEMERRMLRRLRRTQRFWRRQLDRFVWWAATVTWAAVLTVPAPRTPNWRPGGPQLRQPQLRWDTQFSGTRQSQRRSGRAWRGPQSTAGSSTKLESGRA